MAKTKLKLDSTSGNRCYCNSCGEYFSSPHSFDFHRKGQHGIDRHCLDPERAGMALRNSTRGTYWTVPRHDDEMATD